MAFIDESILQEMVATTVRAAAVAANWPVTVLYFNEAVPNGLDDYCQLISLSVNPHPRKAGHPAVDEPDMASIELVIQIVLSPAKMKLSKNNLPATSALVASSLNEKTIDDPLITGAFGMTTHRIVFERARREIGSAGQADEQRQIGMAQITVPGLAHRAQGVTLRAIV